MVFGIPCVNGTLNGFFNVGNKYVIYVSNNNSNKNQIELLGVI